MAGGWGKGSRGRTPAGGAFWRGIIRQSPVRFKKGLRRAPVLCYDCRMDTNENLPRPVRVGEREMAEALLRVEGRCAIVAHLRPDGDAVGASLGLCRALRAAGRRAVCLSLGPIADTYDVLDARGLVEPAEAFVPAPGDALVALDCGDPSRLREEVRPLAARLPVLCIDHHKSSAGFPGGLLLLEPEAGSASEIVFRVVRLAGLPVDREAAEAFWVGIVTDTGRFSYSATSPETLRAGAELVALGVRTERIAEHVYGRVPLRRLRLQRRFLERLEVSAGGAVAVGVLTPEDYAAEGCDSTDSENFVDLARSVRGCELAAFVRRVRPDGKVNVSLRCHPPHDAAALCAEWGGGGHAAAAGATLDGPLEDAVRLVTARLDAAAR